MPKTVKDKKYSKRFCPIKFFPDEYDYEKEYVLKNIIAPRMMEYKKSEEVDLLQFLKCQENNLSFEFLYNRYMDALRKNYSEDTKNQIYILLEKNNKPPDRFAKGKNFFLNLYCCAILQKKIGDIELLLKYDEYKITKFNQYNSIFHKSRYPLATHLIIRLLEMKKIRISNGLLALVIRNNMLTLLFFIIHKYPKYKENVINISLVEHNLFVFDRVIEYFKSLPDFEYEVKKIKKCVMDILYNNDFLEILRHHNIMV